VTSTTAQPTPAPEPAQPAQPSNATADASTTKRSVPRAGWMVIANKDFGDHLLSSRFIVLLLILGLAAGIPIFLATEQIKTLASQVSGVPALFIALFIIGPQDVSIFQLDVTVQSFIGLVAPLLGLAFAFDAVNGERSQGTLPRLLSQPIHRDDVINGKFAAGLGIIGLVLVTICGLIAGFGMIRLGIVPQAEEVLRLIIWLAVTIIYVGLWLAFGLLLSVVVRRAATSALIGFGVWLIVAVFGQFLARFILAFLIPVTSALTTENLQQLSTQTALLRLLPTTLYNEISLVLLNPGLTQTSTPATVGQTIQLGQQIPSLLSLGQSFLLVWPQLVALIAMMVACFAAAYVLFMRQEVRA
jgi:ABC-2 type transport system permease protein